jgi:small subunit ribosomal protein S16
MGTKQRPYYRIVVSDSRLTPSGRFVDVVGTYDPGKAPAAVRLDVSRADAWIRKGAHPSETVKSLLIRARGASGA